MDTTNCSAFWGTDQLFQRTPQGTCNSSLIFVWVFYGVITLGIRFIASTRKWLSHFERKRKNLKTSALGPTISLSLSISYTLFLVLFLTNIINVFNGFSFSLYTVCYLLFAAMYSLSLFRMVRLGAKFVSVSNKELGNTSALEKFDKWGLFFIGSAALAATLMSIVLIIVGPIMPDKDELLGQIGWASKGGFQFFITLGLIWQLQRCYFLVSLKLPNSDMKILVLRKLRRSQLHYTIFGMGLAVFYFILAAQLIPWTYGLDFSLSVLLQL